MVKENITRKPKYIPETIRDNTWHISRRKFVGTGLLAASLTGLPSLSVLGNIVNTEDILSTWQLYIITSVQDILFPSDNNGPGAKDIFAGNYLIWVLSDKRMDPEEKEYIIDGIGWIEETSNETFSKSYSNLSQDEKESLFSKVSKEDWGSSWLSVILTFIFEALLCDPQYGGNPDSIGWKWLEHIPGHPGPAKTLLYPEILRTVSRNS